MSCVKYFSPPCVVGVFCASYVSFERSRHSASWHRHHFIPKRN
jgi:hypothetical protein